MVHQIQWVGYHVNWNLSGVLISGGGGGPVFFSAIVLKWSLLMFSAVYLDTFCFEFTKEM